MTPLTKPFDGEKLPWYYKLFFGMGDIYGGGSFVLLGFYYLFFLTDVVYMLPFYAGAIMLSAKIWDAITDPIMGILSDRTKSRWGRRRPYFIIGILPIAISFFLLWMPLKIDSQAILFTYFLIVQLIFRTIYTMVMVPYSAIIPELSTDYRERNNISGYRSAFSITSSLLSAVLPMTIVGLFTDLGTGYIVMAGFFGFFFALPFICVFFFTYERPEYQKSKPLPFLESYRETMRNRSFKILLGLYIFSYVSLDILMAVFIYFLTYWLGRKSEINTLLGIMLITEIVFLPIYVYLGNRFSKKHSLLIGLFLWAILMSGTWFINPEQPSYILYIVAFLLGVALSPVAVMPWAMLPDIADVDELMTGKRREGIYTGFWTFLRKISSGLALALLGFSLSISGYIADAPPTDKVILTIRLLFCLIPTVLILVAIFFTLKFPLNSFTHAVCMSEVERRRGNKPRDIGISVKEKGRILTELTGTPYKFDK